MQNRVDTDSATSIGHNEDFDDNYCNLIMNISLRREDCSISKVPRVININWRLLEL